MISTRATRILIVGLMLAPYMVASNLAASAAPAAATNTGPIDITANEQEFAGDQMIARGNVRVLYKDSVVVAPVATLVKDGGGNPQKAIFTGHPHLTQAKNKMDAETIIFEMGNSKIQAIGRAHSEVQSDGGPGGDNSNAAGKDKKTSTAQTSAKPNGTGTSSGAGDDDDDKVADNAAPSGSADSTAAAKKAAASVVTPQEPPEKIITDSDRQEYDRDTGRFEAFGHVRVVHSNILVKADHLSMIYGNDNKPETALFTGNVSATQDRNTTISDAMTYSLSTKRLQATGHVKSVVIQEHHEDKKDDKSKKRTTVGQADPLGMPSANATEIESGKTEIEPIKDDVVTVTSDTQDYSKRTGRMTAIGNVHVYYQDTIGVGPQAILVRNLQGKCERVIFVGRAQLTQTGKRWIADHITLTVENKKVAASGHTLAVILQTPKDQQPKNAAPPAPQTQLASQKSAISATKIDKPQ